LTVHEQILKSGGPALAERLRLLDERRSPSRSSSLEVRPSLGDADLDFDVLLVGGGLSLLIAPLLADQGWRVAVMDRGRIGTVHREWNASEDELTPLWETGLFDREEVQSMVVNRYRHGTCRWHEGGCYEVTGVLDHAIDATTLLSLARSKAETKGVTLFDHREVYEESVSVDDVSVRWRSVEGDGTEEGVVTARVMLDGRGAASPYAKGDLMCPTVGGVLTGTDLASDVGEILATVDHVEDGHQHLWEAFPGRPGEVTVYLFYYADASKVGSGAPTQLYGRFFDRVQGFTGGEPTLIRPTFGYIPGWSRLSAGPRSPHPRLRLFGDAASRHSPLTFCGFGSMLRQFGPVAKGLERALREDRWDDQTWFEPEPIHAYTGALSKIMANPPARPEAINALLDAAFGSLHGMGNERFASLLKDTMTPRQFTDFLRATARRRPRVYMEAGGRLGLVETLRWSSRLAKALWSEG
jgi:lycopene cyclase CruA